MVQQEHAHEAAPQDPGEPGDDRAADRDAEHERRGEPDDDPQQERAVDEADRRVVDQVAGVAVLLAALRVQEQPAEVGVREAAQRAAPAVAVVDVRRVRIARHVGEGVVLAVVGDPGDHRAFDRHRAERGEGRAHPLLRLERPVGEMPVEADRDAQPRQDVEGHEDDDVAPVQQALPGQHGGGANGDERHDGGSPGQDPVQPLVRDRFDVIALHHCGHCLKSPLLTC